MIRMSTSKNVSMMSPSEKVSYLNSLVALSQEHFKSNRQETYTAQLDITKTYMWLAVTLITGLMIIYDKYSLKLSFVSVLFWFSMMCSLIAIAIGITCLSSLFLPKTQHIEPYNYSKDYVNNMKDYPSYEQAIVNLSCLCQYFDETIPDDYKIIKARAIRLRTQAILCLVSLFLGVICFLVLNIGG